MEAVLGCRKCLLSQGIPEEGCHWAGDCLSPGCLAVPRAALHCRKAAIPLQSWVIQIADALCILSSVRDDCLGMPAVNGRGFPPSFCESK